MAIVQIPSSLPRIVRLPYDGENPEAVQFTLLDDIIYQYATMLFPGYKVAEGMLFKVTRDADFAVDEDESIDLSEAMEAVLEKRQSSLPLSKKRSTRSLRSSKKS